MAKKIEKWVSTDGTEWDTEEQALRCDDMLKFADKIGKMTVYGNVDPRELLVELTNGDLGQMVVDFRTKWPVML